MVVPTAGGGRVVVITGADHPTGYGTARALAGTGAKLIGLYTDRESPYCQSRLWASLIRVDGSESSYLTALIGIGKRLSAKAVLFTTQDDLVLLVSRERARLGHYFVFVLPSMDTVNLLMDKTRFHSWAIKNGFSVPSSTVVCESDDFNRSLSSARYPVILKPMTRSAEWDAIYPRDKVLFINSPADAERLHPNIFSAVPRLLLQEWIPGNDCHVHFCLVYFDARGEPVGNYTGQKLLQWPPLVGSTALAIGRRLDRLTELTLRLFRECEFKGLGSLEAKLDQRTGEYYITEPTVGRNDLQSYIAVAGGLNLSQIAFYDALGKVCAVPRTYKAAIWCNERTTYGALKRTPGLLGPVLSKCIFKGRASAGLALMTTRDPWPFLAMVCRKLRNLLGR